MLKEVLLKETSSDSINSSGGARTNKAEASLKPNKLLMMDATVYLSFVECPYCRSLLALSLQIPGSIRARQCT